MFNFIRKTATGGEREKETERKRDKKERKEKAKRDRLSMSAEELLRLDEVRKSLKLTRKRKEKLPSGITADYTADFLASMDARLETGAYTQSDSSETSLNSLNHKPVAQVPPLPPKPPKRGILKASKTQHASMMLSTAENTLQNEVIAYENLPANGLLVIATTTSPSNDSLTDTTNSSFATPPFSLSPVGERLKLPPVVPLVLPPPRTLIVPRQRAPRTDFGFSLRRAMVLERHLHSANCMKAVIFAEPGAMTQHHNETGLLPGDKLLKVNGVDVEGRSREDIIDLIKASGESVELVVQPVAELSELSRRSTPGGDVLLDDTHIKCGTLRRSGSRFGNNTAKTDEQIASEKQWLDAERLWLVHRAGFTQCRRAMEEPPAGRVRVHLVDADNDLDSLLVDEDDVEVCNPPAFDRVEDLAALQHVNESSVLHTLRQRYANSLIHTYAGSASLLVLNPMKQLSIYSEKVVALFRGCKLEDMPPHIYSMAQSAYHAMLATRKDQSIIFIGRSGGGKTTNFRHCAHYLAAVAGAGNRLLTLEKLSAVWTILEAFGNCATMSNANATRFTQIFSMDFDASGGIVSASIQPLMLERHRVLAEAKRSFHIITMLLDGAESALRKELQMDAHAHAHRSAEFGKVRHAMHVLGVAETDAMALWSVLAAVHHLRNAGCARNSAHRWQFAHPACAQRAAHLLGAAVEELARVIFGDDGGAEALDAFVVGLYVEVFNACATLVNRAVASNAHAVASILLVDVPGFQNAAGSMAASFEELCHNYLNERLQMLCHHANHVMPRDRYAQEHVDAPPAPSVGDQEQVVRFLDRAPAEQCTGGLLWQLDDAKTAVGFVERLCDREHQHLVRKVEDAQFVVQHLQATSPVLYTAADWLKMAAEHPVTRSAISLLQESGRDDVSKLFVAARGLGAGAGGGGAFVGIDGAQSLRRASSIRRTFAGGAAKRKSIGLQVKFTVDGLVETIRRTKMRFVHCMLPQRAGGVAAASNGSDLDVDVDVVVEGGDEEEVGGGVINVPLLRSQVRAAQILDTVRLHKQGFPVFMPLAEFRRRFRLLAPDCVVAATGIDDRRIVDEMLMAMDVDMSGCRVGLSLIFFRSGVLGELEHRRDERLGGMVRALQAHSRGFLARKRLAKRQLAELAVRCVQRNVRQFLNVRDWPWWRLLVRVTPLLNVHRTEEALKAAAGELEAVRAKLERVDAERSALKHDADKMEAKLSKMTVDLAEEHLTATMACERLEAETRERERVERELSEASHRGQQLQQQTERLEMELLYARADLNGIDEEGVEEAGAGDAIYRQRYERAARELEFTKRRLQQQHEDDLEQLVALKQQLEKKLADAYEAVEEQRQVVAQWKRKVGKLNAELADAKHLLEAQNGRNSVLEKRQRKFDGEAQLLHDELRMERAAKERLARDKEALAADKFGVESALQEVRAELEARDERCAALVRELDEATSGGGDEDEIAMLRKQKVEGERRLHEQDEELDELAGQVQLLEQAKLRLEMSLEQMRKQAKREAAAHDEELEEARAGAQKKLRALEAQLEGAHEERTALVREKHELERRLAAAMEARNVRSCDEALLVRARRDLKRTKALLRDTQTQLERARAEHAGKATIRTLRNQLEDAEVARAAAVKARTILEADVSEAQTQLEDACRARADADERCAMMARERSDLQTQCEENEEELADVLRKYKACVAQTSRDQLTLQEQVGAIAELEGERDALRDQLAELTARLESRESVGDASAHILVRRGELKVKELESKLLLEQTTKQRHDVQLARMRETVDKLQTEVAQARAKEQVAQDHIRKLQRSVRELRDEHNAALGREGETLLRRKDVEKRCEALEAEAATARTDLRLALKRIEDLQSAIQGELDDDGDDDDDDDSMDNSDSYDDSDDSVNTFLANHNSSATAMATPKVLTSGKDGYA